MAVFFTADTHWNHPNIIDYSHRPFADIEEMTEALVERWNAKVGKGDVVYHLGDFMLTRNRKDQPMVEAMLRRLNGCKHLIIGNHDREAVTQAKGWAWVGDYKRIRVAEPHVILFHYCIRSWHHVHRGAIHLHGHSHGSLTDNGGGKVMDVGVDCHNYAPISYEEVEAYMAMRPIVAVDHHVGDDE